jgi:predicted DNA-binding protein YlxM (UPF0122 family)
MAISSQSAIFKPSDYIAPVDLNLMGKVLEYKQSQFDQGVQKTQNAIDSAASLDVVRGVDKDYLNQKISSLVDQANNIAGADFSDPNVTNQIGGLASQIYNDPNIMNAVSGTRAFRYVQQQYQDIKSKNPKNWNPANEWYDMNKFNSWFQNPNVGAQTDGGAGQVTPYVKYEDDVRKNFEELAKNPNVSTTFNDKGLMIRTDVQTIVTPERVMDAAQKLLTPEQRQQIAIEGRYQYKDLPLSEVTKLYSQQTYDKVGQATAQLKDYQAKLKGAVGIEDQEKYQKLIDDTNGNIQTLLAPVKRSSDQLKENVYLNDKLKGWADTYASSQVTSKIQPNEAKMFSLRYEMDKKKFEYQQGHDAVQQQIEMAKEGLTYFQDPITGKTTIIQDPNARQNRIGKGKLNANGEPDYSSLPGYQSVAEGSVNENNKQSLDARKTNLTTANHQLMVEYAQSLGWRKGDANVTVSDLLPDGHLAVDVTPDMKTAMQQAQSAWEAMASGKKINYQDLDPRFKSFASKYQENQKEIEAIDDFYGKIDSQIQTKYGVTPDQIQTYNRVHGAIQNSIRARQDQFGQPQSYVDPLTHQVIQNSDQNLFNTINGAGAALQGIDPKRIQAYLKNKDAERDKLINSAGEVYRYPTETVTDDKGKNLSKMLAGNIVGGNLHAYDQYGKTDKGASAGLDPERMEVLTRGYKSLEGQLTPVYNIRYKTGPKPNDYTFYSIPVDQSQQDALGFGNDLKPSTGYPFALRLNGQVKGVLTTSGRNYDLRYDIVKYHPGDPNDQSVFVRVYKGDKPIVLDNLYLPTYQHAINFMEGLTKDKSIDDAFTKLGQIAPSTK